ncbi:MAG TPA: GGDEF domain-containing protein [Holophagaceae bacterium]|nr:GGDEF domain-containing protein [Holophagaceae bacterium]
MSLLDLGPVRLRPEDAPYEEALRAALVQEVYDRSALTLAALVPVLWIFKEILDRAWREAPSLRWAFVFIALVMGVRALFLSALKRGAIPWTTRRLGGMFFISAVLQALGFALMNILAWPHLDAGQIGLLIITHTGINAVAMTSMSASAWSYLAYAGIDILSLLGMAALRGGIQDYNHLLVLMLVIYLGAVVAMSLQNHRLLVDRMLTGLQLKALSLQDSLTGLRNRRYLQEFMGPESEQILRSWNQESPVKQSLAILLLDLDHFKQVNDTHGHAAGDAVLKQLATLLSETLRKQDLVIRWGGEEFVLVARGADRGYALMLAERIRERVADHTFRLPDGAELHRSCSIGYSLYPFDPARPQHLGWEQVLGLADACLYRAKGLGRNRAIGLLPGERPWADGTPVQMATQVTEVEQDLQAASQAGLVKLLGELR